jgi:alginate O-acetyltransferase complex protein AlgI
MTAFFYAPAKNKCLLPINTDFCSLVLLKPMVFSSLVFLLVFFPLSLLGNYLFKSVQAKNIVLILFSLIFYSWGEPVWIFLLLGTTLIDFFMAKLIEKHEGSWRSGLFLGISVFFSVGALVFFKYSGFLCDLFNSMTGISIRSHKLDLPIGISFYTFQSVSYILDVYRGQVKAQTHYSKYLLYISLFHQLVAGPIVRYSDIEKELENRNPKWNDISHGVNRFAWGLFKKVFFANSAGVLVAGYLERDLSNLSVVEAVAGIVLFAIQLYYDFSGYSDMAIGMGRMLGFHYLENFNFPYVSKSIKEFWTRWHMSLGTFLRDYLFTPIAFNKRHWGQAGTVYALIVTFALSGLWHGASWNFILWGLYFAVLIIVEEWFLNRVFKFTGNWLAHCYLIIAIFISYPLFYFVDMEQLKQYYLILFSGKHPFISDAFIPEIQEHIYWLSAALLFLTPAGKNMGDFLKIRLQNSPGLIGLANTMATVAFLWVSISLLVAKSFNPFLYFRF